jgi:hypothetical protein
MIPIGLPMVVNIFVGEGKGFFIAHFQIFLQLITLEVKAVTMGTAMSAVIADHRPPLSLDYNLELDHKPNHLAPLRLMMMTLLSTETIGNQIALLRQSIMTP